MKRIAVLSAAALIGAGSLVSTAAEARGGGAIAAGIIGGLAAGALIGAVVQADAAPGYGAPYGGPYRYRAGPEDGYAPAFARPRRVYEEVEPVYTTRRVVTYETVPAGYRHRRWHDDRDCDDGYDGRRW